MPRDHDQIAKDAACQTVAEETLIVLCLRKMGDRISVMVLIGLACVILAWVIKLVYTNRQLQQTVLFLEKSNVSLSRDLSDLTQNLTEMSRVYTALNKAHKKMVAEKSELAIAVEGLKGNVSAFMFLEEEKRTRLRTMKDFEESVRALSKKLSQITKENRHLNRIIPNLKRKLMTVHVQPHDCEENLRQEISSSSEASKKLSQEKENLAKKKNELETKLSVAMEAEKKALVEIDILKVELEKLRNRPHPPHLHPPRLHPPHPHPCPHHGCHGRHGRHGHHGKLKPGKCKRKHR